KLSAGYRKHITVASSAINNRVITTLVSLRKVIAATQLIGLDDETKLLEQWQSDLQNLAEALGSPIDRFPALDFKLNTMRNCQRHDGLKIYDFCGTLFRGNTTLQFLRYVCLDAPPAGHRQLCFYAWWLVAALLRRLWPPLAPWRYMALRVRALRGLTDIQIKTSSEAFFDKVLVPNALPLLAMLETDRREGRGVVVASFTLQPILDALSARHAGVVCYGNSLAFHGGRCTGGYAFVMQKEGKYSFLRQRYDEAALSRAMYYTDDPRADSDLMVHVHLPMIQK
ncbi:MAG: HAD family hydrolase, partial [Lentisphaerota bacterium]